MSKQFSHEKYAALVEETVEKINSLSKLKGGEYAGDVDRLANFRRNGEALGLPMEAIWHTYAAKHWDAVTQYIKDLLQHKNRDRLEPLSGRLDDIIVYCILFKAMLAEREEPEHPELFTRVFGGVAYAPDPDDLAKIRYPAEPR